MRLMVFAAILMVCLTSCGPSVPAVSDDEVLRLHNKAVGEMGSFRYSEAFDLLTTIVAARPDDPRFKVDLSIAQLNRQREGDEAAAMARLVAVLSLHPDDARARYTAAILTYNQGDLEAAQPWFQAVAVADPSDAYAAYYAGQTALQLGNLDVAVTWLQEATGRDRYLRSAVYALAQAQRRRGDGEAADGTLQLFIDLESDPRSTVAQIKYTRMGEKALVRPLKVRRRATPQPTGPLFGSLRFKSIDHPIRPSAAGSITVGDFNGDGNLDVLTPACGVAETFFSVPDEGFVSDRQRTLPAAAADSRAMLVGDIDDDGRVEVVVCRDGVNAVMQRQGEVWEVVTGAFAGIGGGELETVDGALFDADHDGDLDLFYVNADGPNQLMNNNGDGTFTDIAAGTVLAGRGDGGRQVLLGDLDRDRDTDIIVFYETPPHEAYFNDRLWQWHTADEIAALLAQDVAAAGVADLGAPGSMTIVTRDGGHALKTWSIEDYSGVWTARDLAVVPAAGSTAHFEIADVTGSGRLDIVATTGQGVVIVHSQTGETLATIDDEELALAPWTLLLEDPSRGPSLAMAGESSFVVWPPGSGRFPFSAIDVAGRRDPGHALRSNSSGIGTQVAARVQDRWTVNSTLRLGSGPGQSLQPLWFGLGGAPAIDFVALTWSDGVFQTELDLQEGQVHEIVETQRQLSSCPVLFVRSGGSWEFISDVLGVGGLGFATGPGTYAPSRPWESFLLPASVIDAADGPLELLIAEPMEEACYLDRVAVTFHDVPEGWGVVVDERMGTAPPEPTGRAIYYQRQLAPVAVRVRGRDVTATAIATDRHAIDVGPTDLRFLGHLEAPLVITITFGEDLTAGDPVLVIDGWVEYPYSQTMFAASQAGVTYDALTLEAKDARGVWVVVAPSFGYPAGMPRRMALPMKDLPPGTTQLRLWTNQEIYIDSIAVVMEEHCPESVTTTVGPLEAMLEAPGFPRRVDGPQRRPGYDFSTVTPLWDTRHLRGLHTAMGDVLELVTGIDDAPVVFGPGEGVRLLFLPPPHRHGLARFAVLEVQGWCKDMDLYTDGGGVIDPLPRAGGVLGATSQDLLDRTRTRYMSGY